MSEDDDARVAEIAEGLSEGQGRLLLWLAFPPEIAGTIGFSLEDEADLIAAGMLADWGLLTPLGRAVAEHLKGKENE